MLFELPCLCSGVLTFFFLSAGILLSLFPLDAGIIFYFLF